MDATDAKDERGLYLRPSDCARDIGRSRPFIYALVSRGELVGVKVGRPEHRALRIPREAWDAWLEANVEPAPGREAAS